MNYAATYCALISKRLRNPISKDDCYVEKHHIIPKSEGGLDESDNLVNLTAREHYIAHLLLAKIYDDSSMWCAVQMMRNGKKPLRVFKFNSKLYEAARIKRNQLISMNMKGKPKNRESVEKQRKKLLGRKVPRYQVEKSRLKNIGKKRTQQTKDRIRNAIRGLVRS